MAHSKPRQPEPDPSSLPPHRSDGAATTQADHAGAAETRFQAMVELAPDAILALNPDNRITLVNREAERIFGRARADLLGHPFELLVPAFPQRVRSAHLEERRIPMVGRRQDGSEFPIEVTTVRLAEAGGESGESLVTITRRDTYEEQRAEAANAELRKLLALTDTALTHLKLEDLLVELLHRTQEVIGVDNVAILLLDANGQELRVRAASGMEAAVSSSVRIPLGVGFAGRIAATRAPLIVDDVSTFPVANPMLRERICSAAGIPLIIGERLLGVAHIGSAVPRRFGEDDLRLLKLVGERIALAIDRAQLYASAQAARAEAEQERARWQAAVDDAPAFVLTCDTALRLTYINPAYARLLSGRADLTTPFEERPARFGLWLSDGSDLVPPDQTPLARALREERDIRGVELLHRTASGEDHYVLWDGAPMRAADGSVLGAVCVGWDITQQRALEREMRDREAQLKAIIEAVPDSLAVYDTEGHIILNNSAHRRQMARFIPAEPAATLRERNAQALPTDESGAPLPESEWAQTRALHGEVVSGEHPVEITVPAPDGSVATFRVTAAPLRDTTGAIVGVVAVNRDVTARKRLEREHEEAHARELAALELNRRLDEFFAIAAHDIRTPLAVIRISLELAQRRFERARAEVGAVEYPTPLVNALETLEARLRDARTSTERLVRLVERLFDVAQARSGALALRLARCDLAALTSDLVTAQRAVAPRRDIRLTLPNAQPVFVMADAERLGEVLANYLTNALKYSAEDRPIDVRLEVDAGRATVLVRDEGPGLPPEEQLLVWEMFHRVRGLEALTLSEGQEISLGLGLHVCRRIIEAHTGGQVGVRSAVGAGSTFWFSLPLADAAPTDAGSAP